MWTEKRGQISIEYLIVVGFVIFLVIGVLGAGLIYSAQLKDRVRLNQINTFAGKVIAAAESVYYAGEPSKVTITAYLPSGVQNVQIQGNEIIFNVSTSSGLDTLGFISKVPLQGSIPSGEGVRRIQVGATTSTVQVSAV